MSVLLVCGTFGWCEEWETLKGPLACPSTLPAWPSRTKPYASFSQEGCTTGCCSRLTPTSTASATSSAKCLVFAIYCASVTSPRVLAALTTHRTTTVIWPCTHHRRAFSPKELSDCCSLCRVFRCSAKRSRTFRLPGQHRSSDTRLQRDWWNLPLRQPPGPVTAGRRVQHLPLSGPDTPFFSSVCWWSATCCSFGRFGSFARKMTSARGSHSHVSSREKKASSKKEEEKTEEKNRRLILFWLRFCSFFPTSCKNSTKTR